MKSKDISNSALCMYLSSKKDVGFWLPSNEILQKNQNLYPINSKKHFHFKMNIWYTEDDKTQYNNLCTTENTIIFSLSLKQNVSFALPSNQK